MVIGSCKIFHLDLEFFQLLWDWPSYGLAPVKNTGEKRYWLLLVLRRSPWEQPRKGPSKDTLEVVPTAFSFVHGKAILVKVRTLNSKVQN